VLRFEKGQTPPANAFWSITMYGPGFNFVANPINGYSNGDRTGGLKYDADGSRRRRGAWIDRVGATLARTRMVSTGLTRKGPPP